MVPGETHVGLEHSTHHVLGRHIQVGIGDVVVRVTGCDKSVQPLL